MTGGPFLPVRLPMYNWPEVRGATRDLERALQRALVEVLDLDPSGFRAGGRTAEHVDHWTDPDLLLGQTCGYPLTHVLSGRVRLLGAPHYTAPGCDGPFYCSHLVVRRGSAFQRMEDLRGRRAVFNGPDSQSGMNALRHAVALAGGRGTFFSSVTESGGHLKSMKAVAAGEADIAAIDAVCWWLASRELPELTADLCTIGRTEAAPGLPLITSLRFSETEAGLMADVVEWVLNAPETVRSRERLGLRGFSKLSLKEYARIPEMEAQAAGLGYPVLA
ncbi:MAG: PhnD/SsuA/transferrin family substrate-binding protein [Roseibium sp.]